MNPILQKLDEHFLMTKAERQYKFLLIYCRSGQAKIDIDNEVYLIKSRQFLTITPKQYYQFIEFESIDGNVLEFTYDFFCTDDKTVELIYHNGLYCHFGLNELISIPNEDEFHKIEHYLDLLKNEISTSEFEVTTATHSLIKLLIIEISRYKIIQQNRPLYTPDALFLKFLNLVRANFTKRYSVAQYASELAITEAKLNELTKKNSGETTQQLINDLIILEAKRLFNYENLNVKQVAYELGFEDSHYFSRFFKKQTSTRAKDHLRQLIPPKT